MPTNGSPAGKSMTCPRSKSSRYLRTAPARTRHDALGTTLTISYIEVQSEMVESAGAGAERHAVCGPGVYRQLARAERAAATPQSCRGRCIRYGTGIQSGSQPEINKENGVWELWNCGICVSHRVVVGLAGSRGSKIEDGRCNGLLDWEFKMRE